MIGISTILIFFKKTVYCFIQPVTASLPPLYIRDIPNFATSAAKLVYRASRKGCSTWLGLEP